ncbi:ATP-binding protein [Candidatus Woesearchaeota archaeon]|nr:ATP-binding protein [Candidatus Woesearchaeota archaeon]
MDWNSVVSQNPWWSDILEIEKDAQVSYAVNKKHLFIPKFVEGNHLILGPRQTGKTTYLKLCIKELLDKKVPATHCLYFVCNLVMNYQDIIDIVSLFKKSGGKYIFLDEISFVNNWERSVKQILEIKYLNEGMNFYFTGSTTLELQKERFPGRPIKIKEFLPLDFKNFCVVFGSSSLKKTISFHSNIKNMVRSAPKLLPNITEISKLFDFYIHCGGFLRAAYELIEEGKIRDETFQIYWEWIAGDISSIGLSERTLSAVLKGVVKMYSSSFSLSALAKEVEIPSHITVRDYLEVLESLYVLRSYWKEYDKTPFFRKERKVYFIDPFIFHIASLKTLGLAEKKQENVPKIVEGIVGECLRRKNLGVKFLRSSKELDFVSEGVGIEVKWQESVSTKDFPKIDLLQKFILSKNDVNLEGKVKIIPVALFALLA